MDARERLYEIDSKIVTLRDAIAVLSFDEETAMPVRACEERGEQVAMLSGILHDMSTSGELRDVVAALEQDGALDEVTSALVAHHGRFLRTEGVLDRPFVEAEARLLARSRSAWVRAREEDDWPSFAPVLDEVVSMEREKAAAICAEADAYDTLLDLYEEGMDASTVASVFDPLEESIHGIMDRCDADIPSSFLYAPFDQGRLHELCLSIIRRMGYDESRGMVSISAHPFTSMLGRDDVRITTRYTDSSWFDPISTIVHECGHALYDMHASMSPALRGTSLGCGISMSLHESQSRFWENMLLRSYPLLKGLWPQLCGAVPALADVTLDDFYRAVNRSCPSAIRVNADELTYPLHVIMRFRLERMLVRGDLAVADLPEAWRCMSEKTVRYRVKNDAEGCLQDVHWAEGLFGYFPSYAMGSIAAAAFYRAMEKDVGGQAALDDAIEQGRWDVVTRWQDEHIWSHGGMHDFASVVEDVTGSPLECGCYVDYLADKYSSVYNR